MAFPPPWLCWLLQALLWVLFGLAIAARYRRLHGTPGGLAEPAATELLFDERYASARSHKSRFTRLGGGSRCMHVSVTKSALLVRPHFPFSLVGVDFDLVHTIPLRSIVELAELSPARDSPIVVRFGPGGRLDLVLKHKPEFWRALSAGLEGVGKS